MTGIDQDLVGVKFEKFNDMAQFTADLFRVVQDSRISPVNEHCVLVPIAYLERGRNESLVERFNGEIIPADAPEITQASFNDRTNWTDQDHLENAKKVSEELKRDRDEFYARLDGPL